MALLDVFKPKWKHSDSKVRENAIKEITDQKILVQIAKNDDSVWLRGLAINKIQDQSVLVEITKTSKDYCDCRHAIEKIKTKKVLLEILYSPVKWYCKKEIIEYISGVSIEVYKIQEIKDKEFLSIIAKESDKHEERQRARIEIIRRIEDDNELAKLANESESLSERIEAFNNIKDVNLWAEIMLSNPSVFGGSIELAYKKVSNEELLEKLVHAAVAFLPYRKAKEKINHCPLCNSKKIYWDEYEYTDRESGPADSFYRETVTYESTETRYKLLCKSCNTVLLEGDTGNPKY